MNLLSTNLQNLNLITLLALLAFIFLLIFGKKIIWWLFNFDQDVAKIINQKKSSEVRVGKIVESIAPILEDFPVDIYAQGSTTQFIGQPVDFVHFTADGEVVFIEVKSGNSQLSAVQKRIKSSIEQGKVSWVEFRVK
jgi:predicted Holliday junction resolvase-like endonuclease